MTRYFPDCQGWVWHYRSAGCQDDRALFWIRRVWSLHDKEGLSVLPLGRCSELKSSLCSQGFPGTLRQVIDGVEETRRG